MFAYTNAGVYAVERFVRALTPALSQRERGQKDVFLPAGEWEGGCSSPTVRGIRGCSLSQRKRVQESVLVPAGIRRHARADNGKPFLK
jgi:hypothetical protein